MEQLELWRRGEGKPEHYSNEFILDLMKRRDEHGIMMKYYQETYGPLSEIDWYEKIDILIDFVCNTSPFASFGVWHAPVISSVMYGWEAVYRASVYPPSHNKKPSEDYVVARETEFTDAVMKASVLWMLREVRP